MSYKIFIDGQSGTTGLEIQKRLENRGDIELLQIDPSLRKNLDDRLSFFHEADLVFLCLPDDESKFIASKISGDTRLIDASTAHRISPGWVYGLPELCADRREQIRHATKVTNPGCHATGFILLIRPLIDEGILDPENPLSFVSITGYSGGGKSMIEKYKGNGKLGKQNNGKSGLGEYALSQDHKHLPEIIEQTCLKNAPVFAPIVADFYRGMLISIPLHRKIMKKNLLPEELIEFYDERYANHKLITTGLQKDISNDGFLLAERLRDNDSLEIAVYGNQERMTLIARYDNLGKGASGAAIQNMNIMLGIPEYEGLIY